MLRRLMRLQLRHTAYATVAADATKPSDAVSACAYAAAIIWMAL